MLKHPEPDDWVDLMFCESWNVQAASNTVESHIYYLLQTEIQYTEITVSQYVGGRAHWTQYTTKTHESNSTNVTLTYFSAVVLIHLDARCQSLRSLNISDECSLRSDSPMTQIIYTLTNLKPLRLIIQSVYLYYLVSLHSSSQF